MANKHTERCSTSLIFFNPAPPTSLIIREMQIKTTMRYNLIAVKSLQITNAGESVEKRKLSYVAGGNVKWCSHYGKEYGDSSKH